MNLYKYDKARVFDAVFRMFLELISEQWGVKQDPFKCLQNRIDSKLKRSLFFQKDALSYM